MNYNKKMAKDYYNLKVNYEYLMKQQGEILSDINTLVQTILHIVNIDFTDEKEILLTKGLVMGLLSKLEKKGFKYGY